MDSQIATAYYALEGDSTMRTALFQLAFLSFTASGLYAQSQNSDITFLLGPPIGSVEVDTGANGTVSASGQIHLQIGFGHTIHSETVGDLWLETNYIFVLGGDTNVGNGVRASGTAGSLITPGLRFQIPASSRLSLYVAAGGGIGNFVVSEASTAPYFFAKTHNTIHGAFDFGGGVDFRLSRLVSLRADARDYVLTGRNLAGSSGHHHAFLGFGFALHF